MLCSEKEILSIKTETDSESKRLTLDQLQQNESKHWKKGAIRRIRSGEDVDFSGFKNKWC